jgi:hypothetical protein
MFLVCFRNGLVFKSGEVLEPMAMLPVVDLRYDIEKRTLLWVTEHCGVRSETRLSDKLGALPYNPEGYTYAVIKNYLAQDITELDVQVVPCGGPYLEQLRRECARHGSEILPSKDSFRDYKQAVSNALECLDELTWDSLKGTQHV